MLKRTSIKISPPVVILALFVGLLLAGLAARNVSSKTQAAVITFTCCSYTPATVTIHTGDEVVWQGDFTFHPLVSQDGLWSTVDSGTEFSHAFSQPGEYWFYCGIHGGPNGLGMSGKVIVVDTVFLPFISQ